MAIALLHLLAAFLHFCLNIAEQIPKELRNSQELRNYSSKPKINSSLQGAKKQEVARRGPA